MGLLSLFKKESKQDLCNMPKNEKKNFLANDLIERMVRIEQRVHGSFGGGFIPYYKTEYFKSLSEAEKCRFKNYLIAKEKRKKWKFLPWFGVILAGIFLSTQITGNVVAEDTIAPTNLLLAGVFVVGMLIYLVIFILQMQRWNRLEKHFAVVEKIISKRKIRRD